MRCRDLGDELTGGLACCAPCRLAADTIQRHRCNLPASRQCGGGVALEAKGGQACGRRLAQPAFRLDVRLEGGGVGPGPADGQEVIVSSIRRLAPWLIGVVGAMIALPADAQNLDAGKSPAQIFADTCSACHRNARELKRAGAGFLRGHYTTSQDDAASMASYLAGFGNEPRAPQQKRPPGTVPGIAPIEAPKQPPRQLPPAEQAKGPPPGQPASKGARRSAASAETRPMTAATSEDKPSEAAPAPAPKPAPVKPVLEPFEE